MKGKFALLLAVTMLLTFAATVDVKADPSIHVYAYTDGIQYRPGDSGTIKILVVNTASDVGIIKNVTIQYPWYIPGLGGNDTINNISQTLTLNQNWTSSVSFTIPTDGRAAGYAGTTYARVTVYYDYSVANTPHSSSSSTNAAMNIVSAPMLYSVQELSTLTILLVLVIIVVLASALIIAYALMRTKPKIST
ncbi:MAG: hypothetical protein ABSC91_05290 [Candidatus Bathyarchaeia archaeon]|jgi:hypothetical protein